MKRPRVLVIYKKSAYQIYVRERRHTRMRSLLRAHDASVHRMIEADHEHQDTVQAAKRCLQALGVDAAFRYRADELYEREVDLLVTIGGDGTLLWAAHRVGPGCPVLAINSAPDDSVGFFCSASRSSMADALSDALKGRLRSTELTRLEVRVDRESITKRVLNDVLFTHASPAATARYALVHRGVRAQHKSSGLWVATAAGSTAAMLSAGGRALPIRSTKLQYRARELYAFEGKPKLAAGLIAPREKLVIESHLRQGRLFLDGPRREHAVAIGARIEIARSREPLTLLGSFRRLQTG